MKKVFLSSVLSFYFAASAWAVGPEAYITQINRNNATISQSCSEPGCDNKAGIFQVNPDGSKASTAVVNQYTAGNIANVHQANNDNGYVKIDQRLKSLATAEQYNTTGSQIIINQDKDPETGALSEGDNKAYASQNGGTGGVNYIKQLGNSGIVDSRQTGSNYYKIIQNKGSVNEVAMGVQSGAGNVTDVVMNGRDNWLQTSQIGSSNRIDVDVATSARKNQLSVIQSGAELYAKVYTQGVQNVVSIDQDNSRNAATVTQLGDQQTAIVDQILDLNKGVIDQYEGATRAVGYISQNGNSNFGHVLQNCPDAKASIGQSGYGGYAVIRQAN